MSMDYDQNSPSQFQQAQENSAVENQNLTDVLIEVLATNDPEQAIDKLATDIATKLNVNAFSIYLATIVNGKETLVELYCNDQLNNSNRDRDDGDFYEYWQKRCRPIFSQKGICETVLKINTYLIGVDMASQGVEQKFIDKNGNKYNIQPSTLEDWSQTSDCDSEKTAVYIPIHVKDQYDLCEGHSDSEFKPNAVVALRRNQLPTDNGKVYSAFTCSEVDKCKPYIQAISACCHHVVAVYDQRNDYKLLDQLINKVGLKTTHSEAKSHLLDACCEMQKASVALMFDVLIDKTYQQEVYFCTASHYATGNTKNNKKITKITEICIVLDTNELDENNRRDAFEAAFTSQLLENKLDIKLELLDIELPFAENTLLGSIVYLRFPFELPINYYHSKGDSYKVDQFINNFYKHMELYYLAYTRSQISQVEEFNTNEDWSRLLKAVIRTTEADRGFLYLGDESQRELVGWVDDESGLPRYYNSGRYMDSKIEKDTLTYKVFAECQPIIIPDVNNSHIKVNQLIDTVELNQIGKTNPQNSVLSWLAIPIFKGKNCYGVLKLITFKRPSGSKMLSDSAIHICGAFADYVYVQHKRALRLKSVQDLNQMTNDISHISGRKLEFELIKQLREWTEKYVFSGCKIVVITYDMVGKLLHAHSPELSKEIADKLIKKDWVNMEEIGRERTLNLNYISVRIRLKSVKGFTGRLIIVHERRFNNDHKALIEDIALDISMLIYQEFLRHQRRRDLATYRHAIVAPAQGLISKAKSAILACKRHADIKDFTERENELEWDSKLIREWVAKTRLLGEGTQLTINKQYHNVVPLLSTCASRFSAFCSERNLVIRIFPKSRGKVKFYFDKLALDVAICNLLDNAVKFSFFNQTIEISYQIDEPNIKIEVINIGHPLPENFADEYQQGKHFTWEDPFRVIPGEGYGVEIVNSIVKAHGGSVVFKDKAIINRRDSKSPFKVQATMVLPYRT